MDIDIEKLKNDKELLHELETKKESALQSGDIVILYELLDTFLLLELDEDIDAIFQKILEVAFDELALKLTQGEKFDLKKEFDLNIARAVYEHALERWDSKDFNGAKELFLVLVHMIDDEEIKKSLLLSLALSAQKEPLDRFLDQFVDRESIDEESYFFKVKSADDFLQQNASVIEQELEKTRKWSQ